jgi:hypothetical protein
MSEGRDADFRTAFLKANANEEFIGGQFADLLRCLIRALAARQSSAVPIGRAVEHFHEILDLLAHADRPIDLRGAVTNAIDEMRRANGHVWRDEDEMNTARSAALFLVEASCWDNAARGRASSRWSDLQSDLRDLDEKRQERRRSNRLR